MKKHGHVATCWILKSLLFLLLAAASPLRARSFSVPAEGRFASSGYFLLPSGAVPADPGFVTIRAAAEALFVTVVRHHPENMKLQITGTASAPEKIFHGEAVEVFLAPHPESPRTYYQFAVNPAGVLYCACGLDPTWRPCEPLTASAERGKGFWKGFFRIPYRALGVPPPVKGSVWRANFVCGGANFAAAHDLHAPEEFAHLVFGGPEPRVSVEKLFFRDGVFHLDLRLAPDLPRPFSVFVNGAETLQKTLAGGAGEGLRIEHPARSGRSAMVQEIFHKNLLPFRVELRDADHGKTLFALNSFAGGNQPDLIVPDLYYYPAAPETVLKYTARGFSKPEITISPLVPDSSSPERQTFPKCPGSAGSIVLKALKPGPYIFRMNDGKRSASCSFMVLPPGAETSGVPDSGLGNHLTLSGARKHALFISKCGEPELRAFYPVLGVPGAEKLLSIRSCLSYGFERGAATGYVFPASLEKIVSAAAGPLGAREKDPRTLFRLCYEAQLPVLIREPGGDTRVHPDGVSFYAEIYRALKKRFPDVLFSIQADGGDTAGFARCCDIFETASWGSSYAPALMPSLPGDLAEIRKTAGEKPVLFWLGGSMPDGKIRTADELRAGIHLSILHGMAGNVIHLGHGGVPAIRTRIWSLLNGINGEINIWYPRWIAGETLKRDLSGAAGAAFETRRKSGGGEMLLAVNLHPRESSFHFIFPSGGAAGEIQLPPYGVVFLETPPGAGL